MCYHQLQALQHSNTTEIQKSIIGQIFLTYIVRWEELINNFICQFVDIFIFMILQLLHFFQTWRTKKKNILTPVDQIWTPDLIHLDIIKHWQRRWNSPPHSSMRLAIVSASSSAILRILLRPSRTTWTTWASFTVSRLQNGGITCFSIRCATCRWAERQRGISVMSQVGEGRNTLGLICCSLCWFNFLGWIHSLTMNLNLTWSFLPLIVRLLMAQAASFWVPKSPWQNKNVYSYWEFHLFSICSPKIIWHDPVALRD